MREDRISVLLSVPSHSMTDLYSKEPVRTHFLHFSVVDLLRGPSQSKKLSFRHGLSTEKVPRIAEGNVYSVATSELLCKRGRSL